MIFTILFACTGNRCRSPYAHTYFARLVRDLPVRVLSAGTLDAPGEVVPDELVEIGAAQGLDLRPHRSRFLAGGEFEEVDLFIGFERGHVAAAVVDAGIDADKAFTLPELVRLLKQVELPGYDDPVDRAHAAIAAAAEVRQSGTSFASTDEVADPFQRPVQVYQRAADEITALCDSLNDLLFRREGGG